MNTEIKNQEKREQEFNERIEKLIADYPECKEGLTAALKDHHESKEREEVEGDFESVEAVTKDQLPELIDALSKSNGCMLLSAHIDEKSNDINMTGHMVGDPDLMEEMLYRAMDQDQTLFHVVKNAVMRSTLDKMKSKMSKAQSN